MKAVKGRDPAAQMAFWAMVTLQAEKVFKDRLGISKKEPSSIALEVVSAVVLQATCDEINSYPGVPEYESKIVSGTIGALWRSLDNIIAAEEGEPTTDRKVIEPLLKVPCLAKLEDAFATKYTSTKNRTNRFHIALRSMTEFLTKLIVQYLAEEIERTCQYCGKRENIGAAEDPSTLFQQMKCAGCRDARYCSRQCQKKDWSVHKILCKRL